MRSCWSGTEGWNDETVLHKNRSRNTSQRRENVLFSLENAECCVKDAGSERCEDAKRDAPETRAIGCDLCDRQICLTNQN